MADALPKPPTAISVAVSKYQSKSIDKRAAEDEESSIARYQPSPLTLLCLKVVADNFADRPNLEGIDPKFVTAITSKLRTNLDITVTGPYIHDENFWKRKALEEKKWENCQIAEHGLSWKQLFFERNLAEELENFGVYMGITRKHEDEMLRPPIDSTHPRWSTLYPQVNPVLPNGKPARERCCQRGKECSELVARILNSPNGIWPALDRCKSVLPSALQYYSDSFAWANLPPTAPEDEVPAEEGEERPLDEEAEFYKDIDGSTLREYVTPEQLAEYQATGLWPEEHGLCLICKRFDELETLMSHIQVSDDYVFSLQLKQLLSHIDLELVFKQLPNLTRLELTYGVRKIGMKYDRSLFGMKISDAMSLAKCMKLTETLTSLILPCNMIDDDLLRMLMTGLIHNQTITHLDLSHNKITNHGVRLLAKLLGARSVIMTLNLADNQIHADGGKYLGRALQRNESLLDLNLRLNRLDDEGGRMLFDGIRGNSTLSTINVSSNSLGSETAKVLATVVGNPDSSVVAIDASANRFRDADLATIRSAIDGNAVLASIDLRANRDITEEGEEHIRAITRVTKKNELALRRSIHGPGAF